MNLAKNLRKYFRRRFWEKNKKRSVKMKKKFSFIVVLILIAVLTFTIAAVTQGQSILEKVIVNKKVRVGILTDYAPWGSRNAQGEYEGFDVDIAYSLGEALGVDVELISVEAPARVPSLVADKIDVMIGCITPTNERAKIVNFTIPYASEGLVLMVWADNEDVKSYHDLAGKTVAIVRGGTPDVGTAKAAPDADIIRFDTIADAFTAFKSKKAEVFVEEELMVYYQVAQDPRFKTVGEPFHRGLIAFGVKKNDQEWLNYLNNFLTNLRFTGELVAIYEKWFAHKPASLVIN